MLESICLWYCWQKIGEIAEEKGRRGIGYQILIVLLFVGLEMTLAVGGMVIFYDFPNFGGDYGTRPSQLELVFTYLGSLAITIVIVGAILWGISKKNDLWIAAAANATGAVIVTTDTDFNHLQPDFLTVDWINPDQFKPAKS